MLLCLAKILEISFDKHICKKTESINLIWKIGSRSGHFESQKRQHTCVWLCFVGGRHFQYMTSNEFGFSEEIIHTGND